MRSSLETRIDDLTKALDAATTDKAAAIDRAEQVNADKYYCAPIDVTTLLCTIAVYNHTQ